MVDLLSRVKKFFGCVSVRALAGIDLGRVSTEAQHPAGRVSTVSQHPAGPIPSTVGAPAGPSTLAVEPEPELEPQLIIDMRATPSSTASAPAWV